MEVKSNILDRQFLQYKDEYEQKALSVLNSGWYVLGNEVSSFEDEFANYIGTDHCVGVASGLDALIIAFRILDIKAGDEVIVQGNTYIASVMGITINGAKPIFVEPDIYYNIDTKKIAASITDKTKAVLVTHLYGQASNMSDIEALCKQYNLFLVEDCAQSHGAKYDRQMCGTFGDIACWSFYPSKNLGAFGDGGAITTNDKEIAKKCKVYRNYGSEKRYYNKYIGYNSRLDELQAGLLRVKLSHIDELTKEREKIAKLYLSKIVNKDIILPTIAAHCSHVWHLFVIRCKQRDKLYQYLEENNIHAQVHYPIPPHLSEAYQTLGYKIGDLPTTEEFANTVLTLPLYNGMYIEEIEYVIEKINNFR